MIVSFQPGQHRATRPVRQLQTTMRSLSIIEIKCEDSCEYSSDGMCDDGYSYCEFGTDCTDCGAREIAGISPSPPPWDYDWDWSDCTDYDDDEDEAEIKRIASDITNAVNPPILVPPLVCTLVIVIGAVLGLKKQWCATRRQTQERVPTATPRLMSPVPPCPFDRIRMHIGLASPCSLAPRIKLGGPK